MRYFDYMSDGDRNSLFFRQSQPFYKTTQRERLRSAVGGLLYIPGVNQTIAQGIMAEKTQGLSSMAICLEDAVGDEEREAAIQNMECQLSQLCQAVSDGSLPQERLPLLFVRVKDTDMLARLAEKFVRYSPVLTGVVLPKTTQQELARALPIVEDIHRQSADPFYAMPILESAELMYATDRIALLQAMREIMDRYEERILNVRVGATDLCGVYGIRRGMETPIYSVTTVANCITDVVRVFGLGDRYSVSGPVWEYYSTPARTRAVQSWAETRGLMEEVHLDLQNGFCGKTCVHPAQLLPVQASYVVPNEVYHDAVDVLADDLGHTGVLPSARHNKMNERKPHDLWARKILKRADLYGVYHENTDAVGLLRAVYHGGH